MEWPWNQPLPLSLPPECSNKIFTTRQEIRSLSLGNEIAPELKTYIYYNLESLNKQKKLMYHSGQ